MQPGTRYTQLQPANRPRFKQMLSERLGRGRNCAGARISKSATYTGTCQLGAYIRATCGHKLAALVCSACLLKGTSCRGCGTVRA